MSLCKCGSRSQEKALNAVVSRGSTADAAADERQVRGYKQRRSCSSWFMLLLDIQMR